MTWFPSQRCCLSPNHLGVQRKKKKKWAADQCSPRDPWRAGIAGGRGAGEQGPGSAWRSCHARAGHSSVFCSPRFVTDLLACGTELHGFPAQHPHPRTTRPRCDHTEMAADGDGGPSGCRPLWLRLALAGAGCPPWAAPCAAPCGLKSSPIPKLPTSRDRVLHASPPSAFRHPFHETLSPDPRSRRLGNTKPPTHRHDTPRP
jgi:hypothetical protein